jgi:hypothetical protein
MVNLAPEAAPSTSPLPPGVGGGRTEAPIDDRVWRLGLALIAAAVALTIPWRVSRR